tara:strand:+ start:5510 stop:5854 length:345 start_codon:yes stop_codon:yes gene_type:complete
LEQIAFSELNMTPETLYNITPRNFLNAQIGAGKLYAQKEQGEWERARWMAAVIINPHTKRKISPKDITKFPWERISESNAAPKIDLEQMQKQAEWNNVIFQKLQEKLKNKKSNA